MKMICILFALIPLVLSAQEPNIGTLTLAPAGLDAVTGIVYNRFKVDVTGGFSDSKNTDLTGSADVTLNIDHTKDTTDSLVFNGGDMIGTDMTFSFFFGFVKVSAKDLKGTIWTPSGVGPVTPDPVTPAIGVFDGPIHSFSINKGSLSGEVNEDFSVNPINGAGTGTGSVTLTNRVDGPNQKVSYTVTVICPARISRTISDTPYGDFEIVGTGTLKATGTIFVTRPITYDEWAIVQGVGANRQVEYDLSPGVSNAVLFAMGFDADTAPPQAFTPDADGNLQLNVAAETREEVVIRYSTDLFTWIPVPPARLLSAPGETPVFSTSGDIGFYQVVTIE